MQIVKQTHYYFLFIYLFSLRVANDYESYRARMGEGVSIPLLSFQKSSSFCHFLSYLSLSLSLSLFLSLSLSLSFFLSLSLSLSLIRCGVDNYTSLSAQIHRLLFILALILGLLSSLSFISSFLFTFFFFSE